MLKIMQIDISELRDYENNPRYNDVSAEKIKISIQRFGFVFPVIIDKDNVIVCGHARKKACQALGITKIPCILVDHLTQEQIDFFRIIDNKSSQYSKWDYVRLSKELKTIDFSIDANNLLINAFDLNLMVFDIGVNNFEIEIGARNFLDDADGFVQEFAEAGHHSIEDNCSTQIPIAGDKPQQNLFCCGPIRFCISDIELRLLTAAYCDYINLLDKSKSFVQFILRSDNDHDE